METFDFTGKSFADALREFLNSFRLPGESMLIERLFLLGRRATTATTREILHLLCSRGPRFSSSAPLSTRSPKNILGKAQLQLPQTTRRLPQLAPRPPPARGQTAAFWLDGEARREKQRVQETVVSDYADAEDGVCRFSYQEKEGARRKAAASSTRRATVLCHRWRTPSFTDSRKPDGAEREYVIRCEDEESAMVWVNTITKCVAEAVQKKTDAAKKRLSKIGTIKAADLYEMVRSLGGDFKYLKDPELEQMRKSQRRSYGL